MAESTHTQGPSEPVEATGAEETLLRMRREKAERLRAHGENPFANELDTSERTPLLALSAAFDSARVAGSDTGRYDPVRVADLASNRSVRVVGRVISRRGFGRAVFLRIRDDSGEIQLFAKSDVLANRFWVLDELDVGDFVEAQGTIMATRAGELSVQIDKLRILTKALRPLPEKWHGMTDVDLRYRRRYLDFASNPEAAAVQRARAAIVKGLREFLDERDFLEVETPTLHSLVGGAAARPFETHHNTLDLHLYLRIAPELYLKRLLVGGFERVYEIGRCYRNEGISTRHNPEFTMLEFYWSYATADQLLGVTEELLRSVDGFLEKRCTELGWVARYQRWKAERPFCLDEPFERLPLEQGVLAALKRSGLQPSYLCSVLGGNPGATVAELHQGFGAADGDAERAQAIEWGNFHRGLLRCDSPGERLFLAYEYLAEPFLAADYRTRDGRQSRPVFILDYPIEVSPLARRKDHDPSRVDRFELFVHGRELCNAFSELNDPDDQAERFREQVRKKSTGAEEVMDYDEDYVRALEHGMPPAAGFGLGVDRLTMMLTSQASIRDVIAFPLLRPERVEP